MKKKIALLLAAIATVFTLGACGSTTGTVVDKDYDRADREYELEVQTPDGEFVEVEVDEGTYNRTNIGDSYQVSQFTESD